MLQFELNHMTVKANDWLKGLAVHFIDQEVEVESSLHFGNVLSPLLLYA